MNIAFVIAKPLEGKHATFAENSLMPAEAVIHRDFFFLLPWLLITYNCHSLASCYLVYFNPQCFICSVSGVVLYWMFVKVLSSAPWFSLAYLGY